MPLSFIHWPMVAPMIRPADPIPSMPWLNFCTVLAMPKDTVLPSYSPLWRMAVCRLAPSGLEVSDATNTPRPLSMASLIRLPSERAP